MDNMNHFQATLEIQPMDPVVRDLWADALDSEEFAQGDEVLARGYDRTRKTEYCCLGVLCELAVRAGIILPGIRVRDYRSETWRVGYGAAGAEIVLPNEVVVWAGLNMASPRVSIVEDDAAQRRIDSAQYPNPRSIPLETLNDSHHPFKAIAKLIRASL